MCSTTHRYIDVTLNSVTLSGCYETQDARLELRACLQRGRVTLASGLTLAGGQIIARVYKKNFTGRVTLQAGTT